MDFIYCKRCGTRNDPTQRVCENCGILLFGSAKQNNNYDKPLTPAIQDNEYSVAIDAKVIRELNSIPILPQLVSGVVRYWDKPMQRAEFLGNGIRLGPNQGSSIYKIAEECSRILGLNVPEIYVKQEPYYNAYTVGSNEDHMIVLHSSLVDDFSKDELAFIIGHELGHIKSKHVVYHTLAEFLNKGVGFFVGTIAIPIKLAINKWVRESEFTADRAGLLCVGKLEPAILSMARSAVGSSKILNEFNLDEYLNQYQDIKSFYSKFQIAFSDHPYTVDRVVKLGEFFTSEKGHQLIQRLDLYREPISKKECISQTKASELGIKPEIKPRKYVFCKSCGYKNDAIAEKCLFCGSIIKR